MIKNSEKGTGRSRKREIGHGWVMGDDLSGVGVRSQRRDLGGEVE